MGLTFLAKGIDGDGSINVPRPIFSSKSVNPSRVSKGFKLVMNIWSLKIFKELTMQETY